MYVSKKALTALALVQVEQVLASTNGTGSAWGNSAYGGDASDVDLTSLVDISCGDYACVARRAPSQNPSPLPTVLPSDAPSISAKPTNAPTSSPTIAPSQNPSPLPTVSPSHAPSISAKPTNALTLSTFDWQINRSDVISIDVPRGNVTYPTIKIPYNISNREYEVTIFQSDCNTPLPNYEFLLLSNDVVSSANGYKMMEAIILLNNATALDASPIFNATSLTADFCVRTALHFESPATTENEVNFLETVITLNIDLSAEVNTFEVTVNLERLEAEQDRNDVNYDAFITAYLCDEYKNVTAGVILNQGDVLSICVSSTEAGIFVRSFTNLDLLQGGVNKFQAFNGGAMNMLTAANCDGGICQAQIQLLALFFEDDEPDDVEVKGVVALGFTSSRARRVEMNVPISPAQLPRTTHDERKDTYSTRKVQQDIGNTEEFDMSVPLAVKSDVISPDESVASTKIQLASTLLLFVSGVLNFILK